MTLETAFTARVEKYAMRGSQLLQQWLGRLASRNVGARLPNYTASRLRDRDLKALQNNTDIWHMSISDRKQKHCR